MAGRSACCQALWPGYGEGLRLFGRTPRPTLRVASKNRRGAPPQGVHEDGADVQGPWPPSPTRANTRPVVASRIPMPLNRKASVTFCLVFR